jgi:hypothetical protein
MSYIVTKVLINERGDKRVIREDVLMEAEV